VSHLEVCYKLPGKTSTLPFISSTLYMSFPRCKK